MKDESLRRFMHDLRCNHGIINTSISVLESNPTEAQQRVFQRMLTRYLVSTELMVKDLASFISSENTFDSSSELFVALSHLQHDLLTKRANICSGQIQEPMDALIHRLLLVGIRQPKME